MFLAYLLINLVICRFFVTPDYSLQNKFNTYFFCFYAAVFIKLKLRPDVACTTSGRIFAASGRSKCYIGTHFYSMTTGGNKVTIKTPLIATRYSLIIK